jgi:FtsP/CotA-like multicopper oxidase with cupredoxin domain
MKYLSNGTLGFVVASTILAVPGVVQAAQRTYYIAAEEVAWDYAPEKRDLMMNMHLTDEQTLFIEQGDGRIGSVNKKAVYIEYTDASFATVKPRPADQAYLGILGPIIRGVVGDEIRVVFKNKATRPYSVHPHGVFYTKAAEGAGGNDNTSGADLKDDAVEPGDTFTYVWQVPVRAGPGPNDPSSVIWPYHSHVHSIEDTNSGLVGAIIITRAGAARRDGRPIDVDKEFITYFTVFDENLSWYLEENIETYAGGLAKVDLEDEEFEESNLKHTMNGFVFGNMPTPVMTVGERVRWYTVALGTEVDLHTPHWHGNTLLSDGHRVDTVALLPATTMVADMVADAAGIWMYHCHVNDHIAAGMTARYEVLPRSRATGR